MNSTLLFIFFNKLNKRTIFLALFIIKDNIIFCPCYGNIQFTFAFFTFRKYFVFYKINEWFVHTIKTLSNVKSFNMLKAFKIFDYNFIYHLHFLLLFT